MKCQIHNEPLFIHPQKKNVGYCKRCKIWYEFDDDDEELCDEDDTN